MKSKKIEGIALSIVSLLAILAILLCSCVEEGSSTPNELKDTTITASELIGVKGSKGKWFYFIKFTYEGHEYFGDPLNGNNFMMHSPNCPCQEKIESPSLLNPSTNLFNW